MKLALTLLIVIITIIPFASSHDNEEVTTIQNEYLFKIHDSKKD